MAAVAILIPAIFVRFVLQIGPFEFAEGILQARIDIVFARRCQQIGRQRMWAIIGGVGDAAG